MENMTDLNERVDHGFSFANEGIHRRNEVNQRSVYSRPKPDF